MVLERAERLRHDGVRSLRKRDQCAEVVLQLRMIGLLAVGLSVNGERLAQRGIVPASQIEEMDWLLEDPVAHAIDVEPPAVGPKPIGAARQLDEQVLRL